MRSPTNSAATEKNSRNREGPRRPRPSEAPPTGAPMAGVLGELAFYYGACWLHYRSEPPRRGE